MAWWCEIKTFVPPFASATPKASLGEVLGLCIKCPGCGMVKVYYGAIDKICWIHQSVLQPVEEN